MHCALAALLCLSSRAAEEPRPPLRPEPPPQAQVHIVQHPGATAAFRPQPEAVQWMVHCGITNLTANPDPDAAWLSLVSTQDVVGIKVFTEPGPNSGTRQAVVAEVVRALLQAGLPATNIIVWDKRLADLRLAGFDRLANQFGVRLAGSSGAGYDTASSYETSLIGTLVWGDLEFGSQGDGVGRRSFVSRLVSQEVTRIINITPLMNHNQAGVAGLLYSLSLGSVDNTRRFENDASRLATAVPEIYALPEIGDKVVLNIVDALICQYEGEERSLLHYSKPLNQLRFSRDPVALDALSIQELERQRKLANAPRLTPNTELYSNAELVELGISDPKRIRVTEHKFPGSVAP